MNTLNSQFDVSYSIDCCVMPKKKKDFLSLNIETMLYTCRLNLSIDDGMKTILDRFFTISGMADIQNKQNGIRYLGETTLFAYAFFENTVTRLIVTSKLPNHVRFSFFMKDGEKYLLLESFHVKTLDGLLEIDDVIDSIPLRYEDIKKAYTFFTDKEGLTAIRQKQLLIAKAAKQTKKEAENTEAVVIEAVAPTEVHEAEAESETDVVHTDKVSDSDIPEVKREE
ncbi:MAG: hypothetical protein ACTTI6_03370 [Treponema sp.]